MKATNRSIARAALVGFSLLAVVLTGCQTHVVHERTRTVYVPAPAPEPPPPQVVYVPSEPAPPPPPPVVVVAPLPSPVVIIQSENDFYEPLGAYGRWEVVGSYGRCWIPSRVEAGWRPYSNGYWQRTDAGWYWASDEPWGWATYHYGRWDFDARFGWVWIPQTQWAPAWVSWREGGGYVGWAPLRPSARIGVSVGVEVYEPALAPRAYVFVENRRMLEPVRPTTVIVNNTTVINKTVNITNVKVVNKTVINEGPRPEVIERESGRKVHAVSANEFRHREETTVAARERSIPTGPERKVRAPARPESKPAEVKPVPPSVARPVEKPAATITPPPPPARTVRPTPPQPEPRPVARDELNGGTHGAQKVTPTAPSVQPAANPGARPGQAVVPQRNVPPVEKPSVVVNPPPQRATPVPVRGETKPAPAIENRNATTRPAVAPSPARGVRSESKPESKAPAEVRIAPPPATDQQAAPPSAKSVEKPLMSPKAKARAAEQGEALKKKKLDNNPSQKADDQETPPPPAVPTRPSR